jgi:hypothetical protein
VSASSSNSRDHEDVKGRSGTRLTRTELAVCAKLGLRPHEYLRRRNAHDESLMLT